MMAGVALPGGGLATEETTGAAPGADTGTGEPLLHLHTLLHGTDRLIVQALKTDRDLPVISRRRQGRSRYVAFIEQGNDHLALTAGILQDTKAANELRERELKEQIKKMRSSKSGNDVEANSA
jgi:hypothetical protein